ncbi:MAG TPA: sugar phosphate isomerase/epimerase family protein [Planctomycetota bacterium]|jgi:sugar phosphate isomerase/epimerase
MMTRRTFLGSTIAAAGTLSLLHGQARAEDKPKITAGCRDTHLGVAGAKDCWAAMDRVGADCVESVIMDDLSLPSLLPKGTYTATEAGIEKLAMDMKAANKKITAFCMANNFEGRPDFEIEWLTKAAKSAKALGVTAIRIDVVPRKMDRPTFLKSATETLKKAIAATEETGVRLAIENHGNTTNDPEFLGALFEGVGSKRLGLTLDTANFYWYGHPLSKLYEIFEQFAPRVFHTHCKNIKYPESEREKKRQMGWQYDKFNCPIDEGDIDFKRIVKILKAANYSNDLCVEDEGLARYPEKERPDVLAREIKFLKGLLAD